MRQAFRRIPLATAAVGLGALWLAWTMASLGFAAHFAPTRPDLALALAPDFPDAFVAQARARMRGARPAVAAWLARRALARDPLGGAALRTLGLALAATGRQGDADTVMDLAATRTWRDTLLGGWVFRRRLQQGRFGEAFDQADALLRRDVDPSLRDHLQNALLIAATDGAMRGFLVAHLAPDPDWREPFIQRLVGEADPEAARSVLIALVTGSAPLKPGEFGPYLERRIAERRFSDALADWRVLTGAGHGPHVPPLDGDFLDDPDGTAFTWSKAEGAGAVSEIHPAPAAIGGRALRVDYDGRSSPTLPGEMLSVAPGRYRLTGLDLMQSGDDAGRMGWAVNCADGGPLATRSGPPAILGGWRPFSVTFEAPDSACAAQWLRLMPGPGERPSPVVIWYARLRLERLG